MNKALNNNDAQLIGYLASKDDVDIGHICSKGDTCISYYSESTLALENTSSSIFR
jgi:hypothetical protein